MLYDKFNEVIIAEHSGDIPPAFIYRFTYIPTGQWYRGYHGLKQHESPFDGTYWNSSKDEEFQRLLEEEPENFKYEMKGILPKMMNILATISIFEFLKKPIESL